MSGKASDVIAAAEADVGYIEKASNADLDDKTANAGSANYTKYGKWIGYNGVPWCCESTSMWEYEGGCDEDSAPKTASCYSAIKWYEDNGTFHLREDYPPKTGDQVFFSSTTYPSGGAHTGLVRYCDETRVYTIEGNTSDGDDVIPNGGEVCLKSYLLTNSRIYGYGTPNYESEDELDMTKDELLSVAGTGDNPSAWAQEATEKMKELGVFNGDGNGNYGWQQPITREAVAVILANFMEKIGS